MNARTVKDAGLTNEELGQFTKKIDEIKRRMNKETSFAWVMDKIQQIIKDCNSVGAVVVDFDAPPFIPRGWEIRSSDNCASRFRGKWIFNPKDIQLYHSAEQQEKGKINGTKLPFRLTDEAVLGAQLLDFYLAHPRFIPEDWKGKAIFFWGTIYRDQYGELSVRYLYWTGMAWYWKYRHWRNCPFGSSDPAPIASGDLRTLYL